MEFFMAARGNGSRMELGSMGLVLEYRNIHVTLKYLLQNVERWYRAFSSSMEMSCWEVLP